MHDLEIGELIGDFYEIKKPLSQGSFGKVYLGKNIETGMKVAIKVERPEMQEAMSLQREVEILKKLKGVPQIPQLLWSGKHRGFTIMITKMLGRDLIYYQRKLRHFSIDCIFSIAYQMINILENIHTKQLNNYARNIIHRDLKPENILGKGHSDQIHLIDFGISKDESKSKQKKHQKLPFIGTSRYASVAAHLGIEQTKKDDLESLGFMLIYLHKQKLPWMNYEKCENDRIERIGQLKQEISLEQICLGCPIQLLKYMQYITSLPSNHLPNYEWIRSLFMNNRTQLDWFNQQFKNSKSNQNDERRKSQQELQFSSSYQIKKRYQLIRHSASLVSNRHLNTITIHDLNHSSEVLNSHYSDSIVQSFGSKQSVIVGFVNTYSSLHSPRKDGKISTFEGIIEYDDVISIRAQLQLLQPENQDLEIKHNMLHMLSVYYNYKNPIQKYLQLKSN